MPWATGVCLIEPGSGASLKTDLLLAAMPDPAAYVPVDISRDFLLESATAIADRHDIEVLTHLGGLHKRASNSSV